MWNGHTYQTPGQHYISTAFNEVDENPRQMIQGGGLEGSLTSVGQGEMPPRTVNLADINSLSEEQFFAMGIAQEILDRTSQEDIVVVGGSFSAEMIGHIRPFVFRRSDANSIRYFCGKLFPRAPEGSNCLMVRVDGMNNVSYEMVKSK